jgi:hypothetical protein
VAQSRSLPRDPDEALADRSEPGALAPLALGLAVTIGLLALYVAWEYAFGHLGAFAAHSLASPEMRSPRIVLTVIALIGFLVGGHAHARRALVRDVHELLPALRGSPQERAAAVAEAEGPALRRGSWAGSLAAIPIGLFVVTGRDPSVPYLLGDDPWSHDLVWALALNTLLFVLLGRVAVQTFRGNQLFARVEALLAPVDLLRPHSLAPFARHGLRTAFLWIGGSSIASIVFVNLLFSWLTGLVLVATLGIGTLAFLLPMRGLHRRLRAAKEVELERVRAAIECARGALLDGDGGTERALRMPGLLAYERRVAAAPEWPLDAPQVARFALVVALGLGSWVGGAVIERTIDFLW